MEEPELIEKTEKQEKQEKNEEIEQKPNIEHIVISGGFIWGLYQYGALKELNERNFWKIENIKSIYGTSIGSVIGIILCLKFDFETIDTYLIDRPWVSLWKENSYNLLEIYDKRGVFHKKVIIDTFSPLLKSRDMEINITMLEFYEKTGIDLHIFVTELNDFESLDISYKTYPDWLVLDACYASCSVPTLFSPIIKNNKCYIDGGFLNNYPLLKCLKDVENKDGILGISIGNTVDGEEIKTIVTEDSSFLDFISILLNRIIKNIMFVNGDAGIIKYEICFHTQITTLDHIYKIIGSKEERKKLIDYGIEKTKEYYNKWFPTQIVV